MLTLIVARARDGAIGREGGIPWHLPSDLKMFQRETLGGALIMGRRTWESLPVKPLKNRLNIVVSRDETLCDTVVPTVEAALDLARSEGHFRIYGIGGAGIYAALLPRADRLMLTEVATTVPDADAHFPPLDESAWREISAREGQGEPEYVVREFLK